MNAQQARWEAEYDRLNHLPSSRTTKPSRAVGDFLATQPNLHGQALDVGAGKGRNSLYLAEHGFSVTSVEFSHTAITAAQATMAASSFGQKVCLLEQSVGEPLLLQDASFDLIIDMMTLHLLNAAERTVYCQEVVRLLKPGGFFMLYTIAADSPAAQTLFASSPGPEPNSYIIPQSGMIERAFNASELKEMFAPFETIKLDALTEFTPAFGDVYERVYYTGVFRRAPNPSPNSKSKRASQPNH